MNANKVIPENLFARCLLTLRKFKTEKEKKNIILCYFIIIYHDFLPTKMRGSHVKSDKTHTQTSRYNP